MSVPLRMWLRGSLVAACSLAFGSSPPVPLSVPERGDGLRSPSPEGRGGQGVRTESGGGQGVRTSPPADTLRLENRSLRLGFDPSNGSLLELTDRASGQSFVGARAGAAAGIWQLDRLTPGDSGLVPSSARNFSWHRLAGERPGLELA